MLYCTVFRPQETALVTPRLDIHLIAIGGTGMAPLACLLSEQGHSVRGSDGPLYPPMSTLLEEAGITAMEGYGPGNLEPRPDLVIVGNAIRRDNPEATAARESGLDLVSMPQALAKFFLGDRQPLVVAGTHGKTTTSSIAAWIYHDCGHDPGFLIGGVPQNLERSFAIGTGSRFVIEGDEYNAAYFDRGPKFLHYLPQTVILTSVEYDHADLYASPDDLVSAYRDLVGIIPPDGLLVACGDGPGVREVADAARCRVIFYGLSEDCEVRPTTWRPHNGGTRFSIVDPEVGATEVTLATTGQHNLLNSLAVWAVARADGLAAADVATAFSRFQGVRRRQEELGTAAGVTVVDDFAHHPTAVAETLPALHQRYGDRRLVVVFEPRSLTAGRGMFFDDYVAGFSQADEVFFAPLFHAGRLAEDERLDLDSLVAAIAAEGTPCGRADSISALRLAVLNSLRSGDVIVTMSSGSFEGLPHDLLAQLQQRTG